MPNKPYKYLIYDFIKDGLSEEQLFQLAVKFRALRIALDTIKNSAIKKEVVLAIIQKDPHQAVASEAVDDGAGEMETQATGQPATKPAYLEGLAIGDTDATAEELVSGYLDKVRTSPSLQQPLTLLNSGLYNHLNAYGFTSSSEVIENIYRNIMLTLLHKAAEIAYCCKRDNPQAEETQFDYYTRLRDSKVEATAKALVTTLIVLIQFYCLSLLITALPTYLHHHFEAAIFGDLAVDIFAVAAITMAVLYTGLHLNAYQKDGGQLFKERFLKPFVIASKAQNNQDTHATRAGYFSAYIQGETGTSKDILEKAFHSVEGAKADESAKESTRLLTAN